MSRKSTVDRGRLRAFYIGQGHEAALRSFAARNGYPNLSAALRAVLDLVAQVEAGHAAAPAVRGSP